MLLQKINWKKDAMDVIGLQISTQQKILFDVIQITGGPSYVNLSRQIVLQNENWNVPEVWQNDFLGSKTLIAKLFFAEGIKTSTAAAITPPKS